MHLLGKVSQIPSCFPVNLIRSAGLVSCGCCNKLQQNGLLTTTKIYSSLVLRPESGYWQGCAPSGGSQSQSIPLWLLVSLTCSHIISTQPPRSHHLLFRVSWKNLLLPPSLEDAMTELRAHLGNPGSSSHRKIPNHTCKHPFACLFVCHIR